jgi:hypothetical protein
MFYFTHMWQMPQVPTFRVWSSKLSWDCPAWLVVVILIVVLATLVTAVSGIHVLFGGPITPAEVVDIIYAIKH